MVKMASTNTSNNSTDGASLDLGALVWGLGDVTIEIWGRQNAVRNYGRIIDYGYGTANYFYMAWITFIKRLFSSSESNQSILKEISPEYSLEVLMLKLKL